MQNTWIWVIVAILILGGGYWLWQSQTPAVDTGTNTVTSSDADTNGGVNAGVDVDLDPTPMSGSVSYNGSAFSPPQVIIKKGGTVTFTSTGGNMWVASASHPDHTVYGGTTRSQHCPDTSGTAFDQCGPGTSYSFTFNKVGTWGYHNHLNASLFGKVVVVD